VAERSQQPYGRDVPFNAEPVEPIVEPAGSEVPPLDEPEVVEEPEAAGERAVEEPEVVEEPEATEEPATEPEAAGEPAATGEEPARERRISGFEEVRDGGYGMGSAAPLDDGAQPLGHAIKGYRDSSTFIAPGGAGYDDAEPDVWFFNEEAARRAGFNPASE
jgi:hypothetical protein